MIIEREYPRLRARALALARHADLADDLLQDACERALCHQDTYKPDNPVGWLFRIMQNIFRDGCRARRVRRAAPVDLCSIVAPATDPTERFEASSLPEILGTADILLGIDELPPAQQSLLRLVHVSGLSYRELADRTGAGVRTIGVRLLRARRRLRAILEKKFAVPLGGQADNAIVRHAVRRRRVRR